MTGDINKTFDKMLKSLEKIEKSTSKYVDLNKDIGDCLDKQLILDKKLAKLIDEQSEINNRILKALTSMQKSSAHEAKIQHRRYIVETILSIVAICIATIAAGASLYPLFL